MDNNSQWSPEGPITSNTKTSGSKRPIIYIVVIVSVILIILGIFKYTIFNVENVLNDYYDENVKNNYFEKEDNQEDITGEKYTINFHEIVDGILIEFTNNTNKLYDATIKIEFYNDAGEVVNVEDEYIWSIPGKSTAYEPLWLYDEVEYSTYKASVKLEESLYVKSYIDRLTIVSSKVQGDFCIIQIQNESDIKLDNIDIGVLFFDANGKIIAYEEAYVYELEAGEISSEKVYIPSDNDDYSKLIDYAKIEVKIINAIVYEE